MTFQSCSPNVRHLKMKLSLKCQTQARCYSDYPFATQCINSNRISSPIFQFLLSYCDLKAPTQVEMGKPQRRRKVHFGDTHLQRRWRTRSRKQDLDQVRDCICTVAIGHTLLMCHFSSFGFDFYPFLDR